MWQVFIDGVQGGAGKVEQKIWTLKKWRKMLKSVLRTLVKNLIKENFYEKRKKTINVLTAFFISHKSDVKTFFNWIFNQYPKVTRQYDPKRKKRKRLTH